MDLLHIKDLVNRLYREGGVLKLNLGHHDPINDGNSHATREISGV